MKLVLLAVAASAAALWGCSTSVPVSVTPGWHLYRNDKYGYEIQYPEGYEAWETGLEGERDGAELRVGLKEYEALTPVLGVKVGPEAAVQAFPPLGMSPKDLEISIRETQVNGLPGRQAEYRWKETGDLAFLFIQLEGAMLEFMPSAGTKDFHATEWWRIVSTFRFTRR